MLRSSVEELVDWVYNITDTTLARSDTTTWKQFMGPLTIDYKTLQQPLGE